MRKFYFFIASSIIIALVILSYSSLVIFKEKGETEENEHEDILGAIEDNLFTSSDVDSGIIPYDKLFKAIDEGKRRLDHPSLSRTQRGSIANPNWHERGPNNRGGRTRAIMIDESDPKRNRIWVGGVSGGLWRTEDITQASPKWVKLGLYFESISISDIAQDPNNHNIIYVSTGESYTGDVQGDGIFKSTDDGATWTQMPGTNTVTFQTINEIYVHTNGDVYAATADHGLQRTHDGGANWERVLGIGLSGASSENFHDFFFHEVNHTFYTSNDFSIYKSTTGDVDDWTNIGTGKPGFPGNVNRVEFALCPTDPDVILAIGAVGSYCSNTFVSNDGGETWTAKTVPAIFFTYGQAWYDLDIAIDPTNCARVLAAGVGIAVSTFQGSSWRPIAQEMHTDHHNITFDPKKPGRVLFGNDGGIWLSENGGESVVDKSGGYVTTQFYAGAIHPDAGSPYIMGGTQDNNSLVISAPGLSPSRTAWGGDGIFCFIDQTNPDIQIVSSQGGNYGLSLDGGVNFGFGTSIDGAFINRSGYDDNEHILYGQVNQSGVNDLDFFRWNINTTQVEYVDISGFNVVVSAVKVDPNFPNRVYFGGQSGQVVRTDNTNFGNPVQGTLFADLPGSASVSCIYLDKLASKDVLISLFNFGETLENLWVTYDAGSNWTAIEGDLPDLPVRWCIFDPADHDRAMIATDAGVWTTDDINGDQTHWEPTNPDRGMPFVRVDMLQLRESDKIVLAATYGRGLMTTDIFAAPAAVIIANSIGYVGQPFYVDGTQSVNAQSFEWDLGDTNTASGSEINHTYSAPGTYTLTLTINGTVSGTKTVSILPYLPIPYEQDSTNYGGDFETHPEQFATENTQGTGFERGVSTKPGKNGTVSGSSAWVTGIDDNVYQDNSYAALYTPLFDLTAPELYQLKFWSKYSIQNQVDGFQVEYSLDAGHSWLQLGDKQDPKWYNYKNDNIAYAAFPIGKSYFTNAQSAWTQSIKDISFLAGNATVSFRFVFASNYEGQAAGLALDNFEIIKYEQELKTNITAFNAVRTSDQVINVTWATGIEYQCQRFELERSNTGLGFIKVAETPAEGIVSTYAHEYSRVDQSLHKVIYYRMKVINENPDIGYSYDFYSDTIVVLRDVDPGIVNLVLTNPFTDRIDVSFSSIINETVILRLFDTSGRLVKYEEDIPNSVSMSLDNIRKALPAAVYILSVQIGDQEPKAYKLFTSGD